VLGPRINAVGRLDAATHALELMLTADRLEAARLAELLERCNQDRQAKQNHIFEEAFQQAMRSRPEEEPVLGLAAPHWHSGVIGIVASKMVEIFARPTIMIALDGKTGRGSARSMHGFNIFAAIADCGELLGRAGGHDLAAGFEIAPDRVDDFRRMICRVAAERMDGELLAPRLDLDAFLEPGDLGLGLAHD